jgi:thiosulfate/3-mercaptopyruvate sulfurtransferase
MNGARKKWLSESPELDTTRRQATPSTRPYLASAPDYSLRAFLPQVQQAQKAGGTILIDLRSPQEFSGEILAPPGLPETCQRGGHIPGAHSVLWGKACNDHGTFKSLEDLQKLYGAEGVRQSTPVVAYCRIGEWSSHTWFVLKYLRH